MHKSIMFDSPARYTRGVIRLNTFLTGSLKKYSLIKGDENEKNRFLNGAHNDLQYFLC